MSEEYLWDRSGPADPEVERLERLLEPLRYRAPRVRRAPYAAMAAAAALALAAAGLMRFAPAAMPATAWQVARVEGAARLGDRAAAVSMPVRPGEVLRTASDGQLELSEDDLGRIDLGPDSELRAGRGGRVALDRGRLHAFIWAPPRRFVLDTPSSRAIDLGCEYTIEVSPAGDGVLRVSMGWVAFQSGGREAFIPAGAQCVTRRRGGPGIPYYEDAPPELVAALGRWEGGDAAALAPLLAAARARDGITLWHLMTRVPAAERAAVYDRLAELVSVPPATRARVLAGEAAAIDLCWNALGLENTDWWRGWEREWRR
jgi:hypothetical protein